MGTKSEAIPTRRRMAPTMRSKRIPGFYGRRDGRNCGILALTMRRGFLFLAILLANTISAATQFKFVIESTGDPLNPRRAGTVRIEGLSYRVDGEGENLMGAASFSTDGGKTVTTLNEKLS